MMDATWFLSVVALAIAMSFTPGPNNMMVMASGASWGFVRTVPHILGIAIGFSLMVALLGVGGHAVLADARVHAVLKWAGAAYLLWLAWRIATADPALPDAGGAPVRSRPLSFMGAALFQWVNPKAWIIAAGALVTYAGAGGSIRPAIGLALIFGLVSGPSASMWTMLGVGAARFLKTRQALRRFNLAMAALLVASLIPVLLE